MKWLDLLIYIIEIEQKKIKYPLDHEWVFLIYYWVLKDNCV